MVPAVPLGQTLDFEVLSLILISYQLGYIAGVKLYYLAFYTPLLAFMSSVHYYFY
jgi:hypothetical protein